MSRTDRQSLDAITEELTTIEVKLCDMAHDGEIEARIYEASEHINKAREILDYVMLDVLMDTMSMSRIERRYNTPQTSKIV